MEYVVHYDVAGFILLLLITILTVASKRFPSRSNRIFDRFLGLSLVGLTLNNLCVYTNAYLPLEYLWLNNILAVIHIGTVNCLPVFYLAFIISVTHEQEHFSKMQHISLLVPTVAEIIMVFPSPLTHFVMYYDEAGNYCHGPGMYVLYIIVAIMILVSLSQIIIYRSKVSLKACISIACYSVLVITATFIQAFNPNLLITGFAVSISTLLIYLSLRNPDDFMDKSTGLYNLTAFKEFYFSHYDFHKKTTFGIIRIENFENLKQTMGVQSSYYVLRQKLDFLKHQLKIKYAFYITENCFLIIGKDKNDIQKKLQYIKGRRVQNVKLSPESEDLVPVHFKFSSYILEDFDIAELESEDTSLKPIDTLVQLFLYVARTYPRRKEILTIDYKIIADYKNIRDTVNTLSKAIDEDLFEVHLQPIYNLQQRKFTGAESLLRLKDSNGKYISPAVFIPLAEQHGKIYDIGDISIRKTCEFIKNGNIFELGIEKVNINLSMLQCLQENIVEHLCELLEEYDIPKDSIRFEVTETIMTENPDYFASVMKRLHEKGIEFAIDDYGTGYSNTSRMLSFPFSEIKFDKSLIDAAAESSKNANSLKYLIAMVKNSDQIVLAEGVETKEMSELLESYGCNLIQGFYYSKPLPLTDFIEKVNQRNFG